MKLLKKRRLLPVLMGTTMVPLVFGLFIALIGLFTPETLQFPSILEVYTDFCHLITDPTVIDALAETGVQVLIAMAIALFCGLILSYILTLRESVWSAALPTVDFFRSIPVTFFIPAFALMLGVSSPNIIWALALIPCTLIILVNVAGGIKERNHARIHSYIVYSGKRNSILIFWNVTLREILPYLITGFKVSLSYSIVVVTVLEYLQMGNRTGLGNLVYDEMEAVNYVRVYSLLLLVGLIGFVLNKLIDQLLKYNKK